MIGWSWLGACVHQNPPPAVPLPPPSWVGATTALGEVPEIVAVINGEPVTAAQLREFDPGAVSRAESALADARREVLDRLVIDTLVRQEAFKAGVSEDEWIRSAVERGTTPVTDADVERFYAENSDQIAQPLAEVGPSLRAYLEEQRGQEVLGKLLTGIRRAAVVEDRLPRFRVAVDGAGAPRIGSPTAPVQIVEFSDFQCPYCAKASEVMKEVLAAYGDQVSLTYRHLPLDFHDQARPAAVAAICAGEQDLFWPFHDALFADRGRWASGDFVGVAEQAKVRLPEWRSCIEARRGEALVDVDLDIAGRVGATGTPAFFVNGIPIGGAQPFGTFAALVDAELAAGGR